jgi:FkbM family methyltransferase
MRVKSLIHGSLRTLGLELRRTATHHTNPMRDQVWLLKGSPVRVVFDVGAHDGGSSLGYRRTFPDATVHAIEPTELPFQALSAHSANDPKLVPLQAAVGESPGHATFYLNAFDQTNSLLPNDQRARSVVRSTEVAPIGKLDVPVCSLDQICDERNISKIDILKMDIQGCELMALRGARRLLERQAIRLVFCEVLFAPLYQGQAYYHDVASILSGYGFQLYGFYEMIRGANGALGWADAIFVDPDTQQRLVST